MLEPYSGSANNITRNLLIGNGSEDLVGTTTRHLKLAKSLAFGRISVPVRPTFDSHSCE